MGLGPFQMMDTQGAVLLVMVYNFLPFMILPIYTVISKIDKSLYEAADLGADNRKILWRIVLPMSIPGIISGTTMVFMPTVTTFIIPSIVGGRFETIGNVLERQFTLINNWQFRASPSIILTIIILITMGIFALVDNQERDHVLL